ncbi:HPr kinase/phosphorylase [Phaeobacter sp. 11ANDIMAR09]|uniref:HPr kinase/phosphorylase n=1 Tax=Phaeobacter sp. 11ANDIMAR09 TaxID=1225647 RepID=UPI0009FA3A1B|nr:HPr kinase/phosphatase C-terminal domain-containing protein [Phaeobacter sp. 11ANDIMAR09]
MPSLTLHASCVSLGGRGILIRGASGSGKSSLTLQLMAFGADLIADDQVCLWSSGDAVQARSPEALKGLIEARHFGILTAEVAAEARICAIVDLDLTETERLPVKRYQKLLERDVQVFHRVEGPSFAAALIQFLKSGLLDPDA